MAATLAAMLRVPAVALGLIVCLVPYPANGHLCIISPHQRGPLDVSHSGSHTCFRHGAPCGGMPAEPPRVTYIGGSTIFVVFQQNYNHYEVGYPGYMDIALANSSSPSAHFNIVGVFGDVDEHAQDNRQNYTLPLTLPNMDCAHCVLRARYVAHKPGERIFYQCSDIALKSSQAVKSSELDQNQMSLPRNKNDQQSKMAADLRTRTLKAPKPPTSFSAQKKRRNGGSMLYGFAWNAEKSEKLGSVFIKVDTATGAKMKISPMFFGLGSGIQYGTPSPAAIPDEYVMDQIACYGREMPYMILLEHRNGSLDAAPNKILWINMVISQIEGEYEIHTPEHVPIVSLVPYLKQVYLAIQIKEVPPNTGTYVLHYGTLTHTGEYKLLYNTTTPESNYVNYQWATLDYQTKMHYLLMGHENTPDKLKARIYTFNATKRALTKMTELDVSEYTISAIQVYEKTGQLFAMSPGLFGEPYPAWTLVTVNPTDGTIKKMYQVAPAGMFEQYYGGTVINIDQENGVLFYVLRVANSANDVIASISLETGKLTFSMLTDLRNVYNLAYYSV